MRGQQLRVVYRYHDADNAKPRPRYYSKMLALASMARAVQEAGVDTSVVIMVDGPVPEARRELLRSVGDVVQVDGGSNRRTYRDMIAREASAAREAPDRLVWFAEDDYLYRPEALAALWAGAGGAPEADYFTLYGAECLDTPVNRSRPQQRCEPGSEGEPASCDVGGVRWFRAFSTTSTYGVRARALAQDARLLRLCPAAGADWDTTTCLAVQGLHPFKPGQVRADFWSSTVPRSRRGLMFARGLARVAVSARAHRRPGRRRTLLGADPELVHHMELPGEEGPLPISRRTAAIDWAEVASDTRQWGLQQGWAGLLHDAADGGPGEPCSGSERPCVP